MFSYFIFLSVISNVLSIQPETWVPYFANEKTFNEPYDYVDVKYLPQFSQFGKNYDWISIAGSSIKNRVQSHVVFTGTLQNNRSNHESVYRKQYGIIVLCSTKTSTSPLGFELECKSLEENNLEGGAKYLGAVVRSTTYRSDSVAFVYCDPLWVNTNSFDQPSGKCILFILSSSGKITKHEFNVCDKYRKCLGGFSVDIVSLNEDLNIVFGLPFDNSTITLNQAESYQIDKGVENRGSFFNFGYSVAFAEDGSQYISSPVDNGSFPYVKMLNGEIFLPTDVKTQLYGGFGTSLDTVKIGKDFYGVIIGAPYQNKQNQPNVGAVYLACVGKPTDIVFGENSNDYFGYSIARLGDIDSDGSEEFIVSAPSLSLEKPGKIYIFKTTRDCKISKVPVQVYQSNITGFGVAISRGFDINFNGMPDFFVTALGHQTPFLFTMPNQEKVSCNWIEDYAGKIYQKDATFNIKVVFNSQKINNYDDYVYQVAIDFLNKDEPRFKLIDTKLQKNSYLISIQTLLDVQDMDLKRIPFQVSVKGVRKCKVYDNKNCFQSNTINIVWSDCQRTIKLSQYICEKANCESDLNLDIKPDTSGYKIFYGEQKYYQRTINVTINNKGPEPTPRVYMSINSKPDLLIHNVKCSGPCKKELTATGQNAKIIIKETLEKRLYDADDFKISVDVLYNKLENFSPTTSMSFSIWGVNDDNNLRNNNVTLDYTISFKPNLTFTPQKTKEINLDSREKPPHLDSKYIQIHDLGTELDFSYIIENKGPELKNVDFKFYFPYLTQSEDFILYVMDSIRHSKDEIFQKISPSISSKSGEITYCSLPKEMINPLHIIGYESHKHKGQDSILRKKRNSESQYDNSNNETFTPYLNNQGFQTSTDRTVVIKCNESTTKLGMPVCGEMTCKLNLIPTDSTFMFNFKTWLFTKTFFTARIADLRIVTTLESNLGDLPADIPVVDNKRMIGPVEASQNVLFNKMKITEDKALPLWPIIVAIIIGIFILVVIIIIAYFCGFFKRKRLRKERQKNRALLLKKNEHSDVDNLTS